MSKLDEIIEHQWSRIGIKLTEIGWEVAGEENEATKQQIKDLMLELIGADSQVLPPEYETDERYWAETARNQLKAELRKKVETL